jgi:hypothetical protein
MKTCLAHLKSVSPYSQSRGYERFVPKLNKEGHDDFEKRTWKEKCHVNDNGEIYIPGMSFKMALDAAAKFLGNKIPGKRNATYTKHFLAGVLVLEDAAIGVQKDDVEPEWLFVNADGVRGSGKRVWKCFPLIREWEAAVTFYVADETITEEVLETHLAEAGKFIGIGRFRPERGGFKGRFEVVDTKWS